MWGSLARGITATVRETASSAASGDLEEVKRRAHPAAGRSVGVAIASGKGRVVVSAKYDLASSSAETVSLDATALDPQEPPLADEDSGYRRGAGTNPRGRVFEAQVSKRF